MRIVLELAGITAVTVGAYQVHPAAAWIVAGVAALVMSYRQGGPKE